ncbi:MAG: helix-turn-helix domain-containing protein [Bacteroidales bacterium]
MKSTVDELKFNFKIWLETLDHKGILGDQKYALLNAIDKTNSLNKAVEMLGLTYRSTWGSLRKIENELGFPLIKTTRGGLERGSTVLTLEGKIIVAAFEKFHAEYDSIIHNGFESILTEIKQQIR